MMLTLCPNQGVNIQLLAQIWFWISGRMSWALRLFFPCGLSLANTEVFADHKNGFELTAQIENP